MNVNQAAGMISDKVAMLVQGMSLDEVLGIDTSGEDRGYSPAERRRLERAKDRVVQRLLKMHNY